MERKILIIILIILSAILLYLLLLYLIPRLLPPKTKIISPETITTTPNIFLISPKSPTGTPETVTPTIPTPTPTPGFQLIEPKIEIKAEIPPELVKKIQNFEPGQTFWAEVKEKKDTTLDLNVLWYDPINGQIKRMPLTLKIEPNDEIIKYVREGITIKTVNASLEEIKTNDLILIATLENKKRVNIFEFSNIFR